MGVTLAVTLCVALLSGGGAVNMPEAHTGTLLHYAPTWGDWRGAVDDVTGIAARWGVLVPLDRTAIAYWDCSRIGDWGYLVVGDVCLPIVVADCSWDADVPRLRARNVVGELSYPAAVALGLVESGRGRGTLYFPAPRQAWN